MKKKKDDKSTIKEIIELVYISSFLKNEQPLSLFLIAPPEQSKTHFLLRQTTSKCHISSDLSFMGLIKLLQRKKTLKHIIIPDFLKITDKKQSTKNNLLTLLNLFLEEGIYDVNLGNSEKLDLKGRVGGIITATTDYSFHQNKRRWGGIGFISRFIVVTYQYSEESKQEIIDAINNLGTTKKQSPKKLKYKITEVKSSKEINKALNGLGEGSPRRQKQLIVLLKCIALRNKRNFTILNDVKHLEKLTKLMNVGFTKI